MTIFKRWGRSLGVAVFLGSLSVPVPTYALTLQLDRSQPGVQDFVRSYIHFPSGGKDLSAFLPPNFYLVTTRSETDTVIVAKTGDPKRNPKLNSFLIGLVGKNPGKIQGPHGETIWYNPSPKEKRVSAYTRWGGWLLVGKNRNSLVTLLRGNNSPLKLVTPAADFSTDGLGTGGIRFWGENTGGNLSALMKESQKKILIPAIQDPSQIKRISGMFGFEGQTLSGTLIFVPSATYRDGLRKDLKFIHESIRRKLSAIKVSHGGEIVEGKTGLTLKVSIGDYVKAQPGLVKIQP